MALTLDTIAFTDDEAPEQLELGGEQSIAVRKYPGGQLDIQTLGAFDDPISWSGILWFQPALARAAALNALRVAGLPVTLQCGSLSVQVVVRRFKYTYINDFRLHYEIEVQPTAVLSTQPGATLQNGNTNLATIIAGGGTGSGSSASGISETGTTGLGQLAMTPSQLANPASIAPSYVTSNEFSAAALAPVGAILNDMSPAVAAPVTNLASQVTHLVASGETLWGIAAQYYASGSQWTQIASANNIQDPLTITPGQQLTIPNPTVQAS